MLTLDNLNKIIGVRDGSSIRQAYQNNSTRRYASVVKGLPSRVKVILREWCILGGRTRLSPRDFHPSSECFIYMQEYTSYYLTSLL